MKTSTSSLARQPYFSVNALSTCVKIAGGGRDAYMEKYGWLARLEYQLLDGHVHVPEPHHKAICIGH